MMVVNCPHCKAKDMIEYPEMFSKMVSLYQCFSCGLDYILYKSKMYTGKEFLTAVENGEL